MGEDLRSMLLIVLLPLVLIALLAMALSAFLLKEPLGLYFFAFFLPLGLPLSWLRRLRLRRRIRKEMRRIIAP